MTDTPSTEVAQQPTKHPLLEALDRMGPEIARALPRHITGDRIARLTLTAIRQNERLLESTPQSFFGALMTSAALGLEPGVNGEAYLVPYRDRRKGITECQLIVGYQGVAKLFYQHPMAKRIATGYVRERDHFLINKGLTPRLEHQPAPGDRGEIVGYYAIAELATGGVSYDYFTAAQIRVLRGGKVGTSGDIADPEHWMERKTALKQVLKLMPKSVELIAALDADETIGSMAVGHAIADGSPLPAVERVVYEAEAVES